MSLASPAALWLLSLAMPIVGLYMLRARRPEVIVGSLFLWQDSMRDTKVSTPWQRPRLSLLLILQLAMVFCLSVALAHPYLVRAGGVAGDMVVVLDASVAMQTTDVAPNRFALAQSDVLNLIDSLTAGHGMTLIAMARQARLVIAQSTSSAALRDAVRQVRVTNQAADPATALNLAVAIARGVAQARIVVVTSDDTLWPTVTGRDSPAVVFERVGGHHPINDLALIDIAITPNPDGSFSALARVSNRGPQTASTDLDLYASGHLIDVRPLVVAAHQSTTVQWANLPATISALMAHLSLHDQMPADKSAWDIPPSHRRSSVRLITSGNIFLRAALAALLTVDLTVVTPSTIAGSAHGPTPVDLTVYDGVVPARLASGAILFINPPRGQLPIAGLISGGIFTPTGLLMSVPTSPIVSLVQLADTGVARAHRLTLPLWLQPAITAGGVPLVALGTDGRQRIGVIAFDLHDTNLPIQADFPVLMAHIVDNLLPPALTQTHYSPGDVVDVVPRASVSTIIVHDPAEQTTEIAPPYPPLPFTGTDQPGVYEVVQTSATGTTSAAFVVNEQAQSTVPAPAGVSLNGTSGKPAEGTIVLDITPWVALVTLVIVCAEWWVAAYGP